MTLHCAKIRLLLQTLVPTFLRVQFYAYAVLYVA
jgi:hypothetical protein